MAPKAFNPSDFVHPGNFQGLVSFVYVFAVSDLLMHVYAADDVCCTVLQAHDPNRHPNTLRVKL